MVALGAVIGVAVFHRGAGGPQAARTPVPADVLQNLTQIPAATWNAVGAAGDVTKPVVAAPSPGESAPTVLYIGAEYCPYCAGERWAVVSALARFGTFSGLELSTSSPTDVFPRTPTFTFVDTRYQSSYVKFESVETQGNVAGTNGQYPPLQTPTDQQMALFKKYNSPPYVPAQYAGGIPFLLVGGRYIWAGTAVSPQLLQGRTWQAIAATLPEAKDQTARAILANANEIAAAVCAADGGQPGEVCQSPGVQAAAKVLASAPSAPAGGTTGSPASSPSAPSKP